MSTAPNTTHTSALKEQVRVILAQSSCTRVHDGWVSGEELAASCQVTRAAVWKAIKLLEAEGLTIEAVRNRGYRLANPCDLMTKDGIVGLLDPHSTTQTQLHVLQQTTNTNDDARKLAEAGAAPFTCVIAAKQTAGRGRRGRPFFSLGDAGIYLSLVLRPNCPLDQAGFITAAAAVAVCRAIDSVNGLPDQPQIKWVNDIYLGQKKVCGILTEAVSDLESGSLTFAIVGIGINAYEPLGGFPSAYSNRAGALWQQVRWQGRNTLAATLIKELVALYQMDDLSAIVDEYRQRSFLVGHEVTVVSGVHDGKVAHVIDIDADLRLCLRFSDGSIDRLASGEVSIRPHFPESV